MCLLSDTSTNKNDHTITELFRLASGIECCVVNLETGASDSEGCACLSCSVIQAMNKNAIRKSLKLCDAEGRAYMLFASCMFAFIAVGAWHDTELQKVFLAGPFRTVGSYPKCALDLAPVEQYPVYDMSYIKTASNLLYSLVALKSGSVEPASSAVRQITLPRISQNKAAFQDIYKAEAIANDKKRVVKTLNYMGTRIDEILKLVKKKQLDEAKKIAEELIVPIIYENNFMQARSYYIGVASLLGQKIAESYHFIYTTEMFFIYSEFIESMSSAADKMSIYSYAEKYFNNIIPEMLTACSATESETPAAQAVSFIKNNYQNDIDVNSVAYALNFAPSYLCRAFKNEMGVTVKSYITTHRLDMAAGLILTSKKTIAQVSREVGYQDTKLFVKHFKTQFGITPSIYRKALMQ